MSARRMAQAIRDGAAQANSQGPGPRLGTVTRVAPLRIDVHASDLELDDDDVVIGAAGLSKGDVVVLAEVDDGEWAVIDVEALGSAESNIAVVREAPLNVKDVKYGAKGDDATDDTAAFAAAAAATPTNGGDWYLPPGGYRLASFPSLNGKRSLTIKGSGGRSGGASEATRLICTTPGAGSFISAQSSFGITFEELAVIHENGFTGTLIDASNPAGLDTANLTLRNVTLSKTAAAARGATGLKLVKAICGNFEGVTFRDLDIGVLGRAVVADYSNIMNFRGCVWLGIVTAPVKNIGSAYNFYGVTVQQLVSGNAAFIVRAPGFFSNGGGIWGGWMGDTLPAAVGEWVQWAGNGFSIAGVTFGYCLKGIVAEDLTTPIGSRGLSVSGNQLPPTNTAIHLVGALGVHRQHNIAGNNWQTAALLMDQLPYYSFVMGPTGLAAPLDFMELAAAPPVPVANGSRLYTDDNGAAKSRLKIRTDTADNIVLTSA